jgi:hypothetical protein
MLAALEEARLESESERRETKLTTLTKQVAEFLESVDEDGLQELDDLEKRALPFFAEWNGETFTLSQATFHEEYCAIFDRHMQEFVSTNGSTSADFYQEVKRAVAGDTPSVGDGQELIRMICAITDIVIFADGIRCLAQMCKARGIAVGRHEEKGEG